MRKKVVYLPGVFDLFHIGHLNAVIQAKQYGDVLIVGIQEDGSVFEQKRKYPIVSQDQRIKILSHIREVDHVISYAHPNQVPVLRKMKPDFLAVNESYGTSDANQQRTLRYAAAHRIVVVRIPYTQGISTTRITHRIRRPVRIDYGLCKKFWESRAKAAGEGLKAVNLGTSEQQSRIQLKTLFRYLKPADKNVIELGCGLGRIAIPVAKQCPRVTAVDFSESILRLLEKNLKKSGVKNVAILKARSYDKLPVLYRSFDVVLIFGILIHLNNPEMRKTILNAQKLIKPSGKVIVRESVGTIKHFEVDKYSAEIGCDYRAIYRTPADIESKFTALGFRCVVSKKLYQQRTETGTWFWVFKPR